MPTRDLRPLTPLRYEDAAEAYLRSLPLEHFVEAVPQATQRKITVVSMDLVHEQRPDIQTFSELLLQYPFGRPEAIRQVVPDNTVFVHDTPLRVNRSFNLPLQPVGPFWVMEYVSQGNKRKDYEDSFAKYERELKVPYYLLFYPDNQEMTLYHRGRRGYRTTLPDARGQHAIEELEMTVGLLDGWVRFWFRGRLLPLPTEMQQELTRTQRLLDQERSARLALEAEVARLRAQLGLPPTPAE